VSWWIRTVGTFVGRKSGINRVDQLSVGISVTDCTSHIGREAHYSTLRFSSILSILPAECMKYFRYLTLWNSNHTPHISKFSPSSTFIGYVHYNAPKLMSQNYYESLKLNTNYRIFSNLIRTRIQSALVFADFLNEKKNVLSTIVQTLDVITSR
jgi:hypothetical protein